MLNATDLLNAVKKAALDAVNASQPSDFYFGKVTSAKPLKILVEQKMTLGAAQLVLTRNVTDYNLNVTVNTSTDTSLDVLIEDGTNLLHKHNIKGKSTVKVHNALQVGDEVILLKQKGGQKYLVLDRVVKI